MIIAVEQKGKPMRTIDADAFTEFLKDAIKQQKYEDTKIGGLLTVADVIEAVISELDGTSLVGFKNAPTIEPQPHWIPCSERLPREEEQDDELGVLVTLGNGYSGLQCDWYHGDHWYDWDGFVVAWMSLPKPWKGDK